MKCANHGCENEFERHPKGAGRRMFCSPRCRKKEWRRRYELEHGINYDTERARDQKWIHASGAR